MTTAQTASFKFSLHMNLKRAPKRYTLPIACHIHTRCSPPTWTRMSPKRRPSDRHYATRLPEIKSNIYILPTKTKSLNQVYSMQKLKRSHIRQPQPRRQTGLHSRPSGRRAWPRPRRNHRLLSRSKLYYWRVECIQVKRMPVGWWKGCWTPCLILRMRRKSWWGISKTILNSILSRCWMWMGSSMAIIDAHWLLAISTGSGWSQGRRCIQEFTIPRNCAKLWSNKRRNNSSSTLTSMATQPRRTSSNMETKLKTGLHPSKGHLARYNHQCSHWCCQSNLITSTFKTAHTQCPKAKTQQPESQCFTNFVFPLSSLWKPVLLEPIEALWLVSISRRGISWMLESMCCRPSGRLRNWSWIKSCWSK